MLETWFMEGKLGVAAAGKRVLRFLLAVVISKDLTARH